MRSFLGEDGTVCQCTDVLAYHFRTPVILFELYPTCLVGEFAQLSTSLSKLFLSIYLFPNSPKCTNHKLINNRANFFSRNPSPLLIFKHTIYLRTVVEFYTNNISINNRVLWQFFIIVEIFYCLVKRYKSLFFPMKW